MKFRVIVLYMRGKFREREMIVLYMGSLGEWRERDLHGKFRGVERER